MTNSIFITYSHEDAEFKDKLVEFLDYHEDLEVIFDEKALSPGDPFTNLFEEIGNSDALIPILSENSARSDWVKTEMKVAIPLDISNDLDFIPVIKEDADFHEVMNALNQAHRTYLKSRLVGRFDEEFKETVGEIVKKIQPKVDPEEVYYSVEGEQSTNPFRRFRTEYFESDEILAHLFAKPKPEKYDKLTEISPTLVKGGRGSGKTMVLKSLEANVYVHRSGANDFESVPIDFFGTYCRLSRGSFATQSGEITEHIGKEAASRLFKSEVILRLVESTTDEIQKAKEQGIIAERFKPESRLLDEIQTMLRLETDISTLEEFRSEIDEYLNEITDFVNDTIVDNDPSYGGVWLEKKNLRDFCSAVGEFLPGDENYTIFFLLDEYENLQEFQKTIVNTLVKWSDSGNFSFKIVSKKPCFNNKRTLEGQELEEIHDYKVIDLDYDIENEMEEYKDLFRKITSKIFEEEGYPELTIDEVLEERDRFGGKTQDELDNKIIEMKNKDEKWWAELDESQRQSYRNHDSRAAFYRLLGDQETRKFGGVEELARLSSGIIRQYLELCGMAYYYAKQDGVEDPLKEGISIDHQTDGAELLSDFYLEFISKNVEMHGPTLRRFVIDLGNIFKRKLETHRSKPEGSKIAITNPEQLDSTELQRLLNKAEEHSVLHRETGRGGRRPRNPSHIQPNHFTMNRVFTPSLEFSPYNWGRTDFRVEDLQGLINSETRSEKKKELMERVTPDDYNKNQSSLEDYDANQSNLDEDTNQSNLDDEANQSNLGDNANQLILDDYI